ncbi:hypothetical protein OE88DRAFT_1656813 [Heliocybe sulcata]|uniref:Uncharacterized protein n=1 Tax=Heliocybe sulcata TaxID=5364 RepID=A0A5C3N6K2_9AGAM|nr:hypothetical protein OE88DRAFT_1656813 [Heliocybe sulcata]
MFISLIALVPVLSLLGLTSPAAAQSCAVCPQSIEISNVDYTLESSMTLSSSYEACLYTASPVPGSYLEVACVYNGAGESQVPACPATTVAACT